MAWYDSTSNDKTAKQNAKVFLTGETFASASLSAVSLSVSAFSLTAAMVFVDVWAATALWLKGVGWSYVTAKGAFSGLNNKLTGAHSAIDDVKQAVYNFWYGNSATMTENAAFLSDVGALYNVI